MNEPVRNDYSPPKEPNSKAAYPHTYTPGQKLFDDVTEFYSWYVSCWYLSDGSSPSRELIQKSDAIRKNLSLIKRIAEVSIDGGKFLSDFDEKKALGELNTVIQDLNSGQLRKQDLPQALLHVVLVLTEQNPKAKVVYQTTELEYRLCINPPSSQNSETTAIYQNALGRIIQGITPLMRDINASAISQGLSQILDHPNKLMNVADAINEAVKDWL